MKKNSRPMRFRSEKAKEKYGELHKAWHKANPISKDHKYTCWLGISPDCPGRITYQQLQLEHVWPKSGYKELEYVVINIKASCGYCNQLKGSLSPQRLAKVYVRIADLWNTTAWKTYAYQVAQSSPRLKIELEGIYGSNSI